MTMDFQPVLKGELVELRPLEAEDLNAIYRAASDPEIWEQHPERDRFRRDVFKQLFDESLASGGTLVVVDARSHEVIGWSRFHGYDADTSEVEIGWTFLVRSHWGGRTNREVKRLMLRHCFRYVDSVVFLVAPGNVRSAKAMEKIGGIRDGMRPNAGGLESIVYRITRSTGKWIYEA